MNKKGILSYTSMAGIAMILVVAGIMLVVGSQIESKIKDDTDDKTTTITLTNATTAYSVSGYFYNGTFPEGTHSRCRSCTLSITEVTNATGGVNGIIPIHSDNYTADGCAIYFSSTSANDNAAFNNTKWNITGTATFKQDTSAYNASIDAMEGISNATEQQGLLGTVIVFGIIIGVVVMAFMTRGML